MRKTRFYTMKWCRNRAERRFGLMKFLAAVLVIAVADIQVVMDVILRNGEVACSVIDSIIAKMVNLVI